MPREILIAMRRAIASRLLRCAMRVANGRTPDVIIGGVDDPYLKRWWWAPRNKWLNVYIHCFKRSDDDRALHDHPWCNLSLILHGGYAEHTILAGGINVRRQRRAGDVVVRTASAAHRIELCDDECWTLFITGPIVRRWGFHCPAGWVHWKDFTNPADGGATIGRGCGERHDAA
jgi:hypothetical protein